MPTPGGRLRPAVLPATAFLAGIACSPWVDPTSLPLVAAAALALAAATRLRSRGLCLALVATAAFSGGVLDDDRAREERTARAAALFPGPLTIRELHFQGVLVDPPETDWRGERWLALRGGPAGDRAPERPQEILLRVPPPADRRGDALATLEPGDEVRVWCRLRRMESGPYDARGHVKNERLVERVRRTPRLTPCAALARWAGRRLLRVMPSELEQERALTRAMLLGSRFELDPETRRQMRDSGLLHLIAISGMQVAVLVGLLSFLVARGPLARGIDALSMLALLGAFVPAVGAEPSVVRAALCAAAFRFGRLIGREGDALNSLLLVAALLAAWDPALVRDPGFELTFLATGGLMLLGPAATAAIPLPRPLASGLGLAAAAYVATIGVVAWRFAWVSPIAPATNLLAAPLGALMLVAGYAAILAADLPLLGPALGELTAASAHGVLVLAERAASWPASARAVARPTLLAVGLYHVLALIVAGRRGRPAGQVLARGAFLFVLLWLHIGAPPRSAPEPRLAVLDVGQGLSVALSGHDHGLVLFDAGGGTNPDFDPGERRVLPHLVREGGDWLDALILTHGHVDHAGGARAVLRELEVGELWIGPRAQRTPLVAELGDLARSRGTAIVLARDGLTGSPGGVSLRVLAPPAGGRRGQANDESLVLVALEAPHRVLVPGDIEAPGERELIARGVALEAELLIVPHHGALRSGSAEFLARVNPRWAVISAGLGNRFGHPHPATLARLAACGTRVRRTDLEGTVWFSADERGWRPFSSDRAGPE